MKIDTYCQNLESEAGKAGRILRALNHILIYVEQPGSTQDSSEWSGLGDLLGMLGDRLVDASEGVTYTKVKIPICSGYFGNASHANATGDKHIDRTGS